jgi:hypothetical protein
VRRSRDLQPLCAASRSSRPFGDAGRRPPGASRRPGRQATPDPSPEVCRTRFSGLLRRSLQCRLADTHKTEALTAKPTRLTERRFVRTCVIAGQADVLPPERSDVGQEIVGNRCAPNAQLPDGPVEIDRVPVNDGGQLCLFPGFGMGPAEQPSEAMITFVAHQLGVPPADFADYAQRDQTRREHVVELQRYLGLRSFGLADWRASLRVGSDAAWATDRGEPIVLAILAHLRANRVVLASTTVLERIGLAARARAREKTFETLAAGLSDSERDTLTGLLAVDPELRCSRFAWLRDYSESPAPSNIVALLERLEYARGLGLDPSRTVRIHAARLARLIDEARS